MAARPPQLLILDEPTNHLDLDSIAAVEAALRGYDGALLVVSHDRDFLAAIGIEREIAL
jgi:ATPase subunit of ABC transporter with duplicated ATPase domains